MEILEERHTWQETFEANWLKKYHETGERLWNIYNFVRHSEAPSGPAVDLSQSRLVLVSSAGGYLRDEQEPFDATNPFGDYTIRTFPSDTPPAAIDFAHDKYDHTAVESDQQVLLPLGHLHDLVNEGVIGELAPEVISFMGYQPFAPRVVDETIPAIVQAAQGLQANAALVIPA